jgi:hypothetical protein
VNDIRALLGCESDGVRAVRLAIRAGWWTVLMGVLVLTYVWLVGLIVIKLQPGWVTAMSGGVAYAEFRQAWFYFLAGGKFILLLAVMLLVWAHLWTRSLARECKE